jgi:hypothetical protein
MAQCEWTEMNLMSWKLWDQTVLCLDEAARGVEEMRMLMNEHTVSVELHNANYSLQQALQDCC